MVADALSRHPVIESGKCILNVKKLKKTNGETISVDQMSKNSIIINKHIDIGRTDPAVTYKSFKSDYFWTP